MVCVQSNFVPYQTFNTMKTIKFHVLPLVAVLFTSLLFTACTKDDAAPGESSDGAAYLITEAYLNGQLQHIRTYDSKNRLETMTMFYGANDQVESRYLYAADGLLEQVINIFDGDNAWIDFYEFDGEKRVSRITSVLNGEEGSTQRFSYSANQIVINHHYMGTVSAVQTHSFNDRGNLVSLHTTTGTVWSNIEYSDFDDKVGFDPIHVYDKYRNNHRYAKETNSAGETVEMIYEYKYNDAGYVTECLIKDKNTGATKEHLRYTLRKK